MSEYKPKKDDGMVGGAPGKEPQRSSDPKPHGDKMETARKEISKDADQRQNGKPHQS